MPMLLPDYVLHNVEVDYSGLSLPLLADQSDRMSICRLMIFKWYLERETLDQLSGGVPVRLAVGP